MISSTAHFDIPFYQYLTPEAELLEALPQDLDDPNLLVDLYKTMLKTRLFDKKAIALQRTGQMGTYAPITGQEAISTAVGHAMKPNDVLVPYYRDYAAQFQRGVRMSDIFKYWGGNEQGNHYEHNKEDLPMSVPIASQCLHAAGIAFAFKYRKEARVAVVSIGDGGTSEGDFYEAMNIAGCWNLPLIFIVNNNQWAISVPLHQQTAAKTIAQKAIAAGFHSLQVDGNDVLALRHQIGLAIEQARHGGGPMLIEALSYRLSDHTTADDASRYQPKEAVDAASKNEPLLRLERFLTQKGWWCAEQQEKQVYLFQQEIQKEVDEYLATPPQSVDSLFDYHFATLPDYLIEQKAMALEEHNA